MKCHLCDNEMTMQSTHSYYDFGIEDKIGYVETWSCSEDCDLEEMLIYIKEEEEKDATL